MSLLVNSVNVTTSGGVKDDQENFYIRGRYYGDIRRFSTSAYDLLCPWPQLKVTSNDLDHVINLRDTGQSAGESTAFELVYTTRNYICEIEVEGDIRVQWWVENRHKEDAVGGGDDPQVDNGEDENVNPASSDEKAGQYILRSDANGKTNNRVGINDDHSKEKVTSTPNSKVGGDESAKREWMLQKQDYGKDSRWGDTWDQFYGGNEDEAAPGGELADGNGGRNGKRVPSNKGDTKRNIIDNENKNRIIENNGLRAAGNEENTNEFKVGDGYSRSKLRGRKLNNGYPSEERPNKLGRGEGGAKEGSVDENTSSRNGLSPVNNSVSGDSDDDLQWGGNMISDIYLNNLGIQGDTRLFSQRIRYSDGSLSTEFDACEENRLFDGTPHGVTFSTEQSNCPASSDRTLCLQFHLENPKPLLDIGVYLRSASVLSVYAIERDFTKKICKMTSDTENYATTITTRQLWYRCPPARILISFLEIQFLPEYSPSHDIISTELQMGRFNGRGVQVTENNHTMSPIGEPRAKESVPSSIPLGSLNIVELVLLNRQSSYDEELSSGKEVAWNKLHDSFFFFKVGFMLIVLVLGVILVIYIVRVCIDNYITFFILEIFNSHKYLICYIYHIY